MVLIQTLMALFFINGDVQQTNIEAINGLNLRTYLGEVPNLEVAEDEMFLFIFLNPDCPISQKYGIKIRELSQLDGVKLIGVQANPGVSTDQIVAYMKEYGYSFPILNDENQAIVHLYHASITPEVFLTDSSGEVLYSGAIDNWFVALGKYRREATEHYLLDAINQYKNQGFVTLNKTKAVGCLIESHSH